jgi:hypothetical protein
MSIGENYVGKLTPMRSNISRFSRGTVDGSKSLNKYLKTIADREQPDKLLSLPSCPLD